MSADVELSPWRTGTITGSRVGKVLGLGPFGGPDDVMREMVREHFAAEPEFVGNIATEYGQAWEPVALAEYRTVKAVRVHSAQVFVPHPSIEWAGDTPDGLVGEDGAVELKVPFRAHYVHYSQRPGYEAQCRWRLECTGRDWCDFAVYYPQAEAGERLWVSRVHRDPSWLPSVLPQLQEFISEYRRIIADPTLSAPFLEPLRDERVDPEWQEAAFAYLEARATREAAETAENDAKKVLIDLSDGKTSLGFGVRVQHSERTGSIDYSKVVKKYAPDADVEAFRKSSTHVVSVHLTGGRK